jgi:WD40 repeat protein/biotin carboxyl carrier protein
MRRRWIGTVAVGVLALGVAACDGRIPGLSTPGSATSAATTADAKTPAADVDIGGPLYAKDESVRPAPPVKPAGGPQGDPIVINGAQLTIPFSQNVPTENPGALWQICTEVAPGERVNPADVFEHPTIKDKKYRRLREGDTVARGQLVALLDDQVARAKYNAAVTDLSASEEKLGAALTVEQTAKKSFDIFSKPGVASQVEKLKAEQDWAAAIKQIADSKGERDKNREAMAIAKVQLDKHELRSSINGIVKSIYRKPGEAVKEQEPVLQIQNLDILRAEGMLPAQYLPLLPNPRGKTAYLEPSAQLAPKQDLPGHWAAVTGVAVAKEPRRPLIVTASEDKTVRVWDRNTGLPKYIRDTGVPVRAVACTSGKSQLNLALFGGDDGAGQLLDLDRLGEGEAVRKLKDALKGRVNSVAFAPDGAFCAIADDKDVIVFDTASGEKKYRFNAGHRGPITSIQMTPQTRLVTAARDKTVRVWDLGEKGAKLNTTLDHRAGSVDVLGVSPDGHRIIFDQDRALHVRNLDDQRTEAVMLAPTESSQFTGFAVFSPDSALVVAAGTADNPLGVWKLPAPGSTRAYQRARLAVGNSVPSCAAVSPDSSYVVVGTQDNRVLVFARPEKTDLERQYPAEIKLLDPSVESTDRKVRIWAELPNPGVPLLPGDTVTIVIPPQQ